MLYAALPTNIAWNEKTMDGITGASYYLTAIKHTLDNNLFFRNTMHEHTVRATRFNCCSAILSNSLLLSYGPQQPVA